MAARADLEDERVRGGYLRDISRCVISLGSILDSR
jgi:hypothetical protein